MKKLLSCAAMAAMIVLAWTANGAVATRQKTPAKKTAAKKKSAPAKGAATTATRKRTVTASSRGKKAPAKRVTWRNRQMSPSPDRYREIQGALAAKGFLSPEEATGTWNQSSSDALKKFQSEQNLESSGKINSLSLIALGLGPRRDAPSAAPKPQLPPPGQ
jgi:peptidoglycan hydrolase-like protein with peptidoglycan-binding domain